MRLFIPIYAVKPFGISIHAPVKGATQRLSYFVVLQVHFNPRTCERCDSFGFLIIFITISFQSTHLWKVRHWRKENQQGSATFQSTHLWKVRRGICCEDKNAETISIHAPVKGATIFCWRSLTGAIISIHAPVKGATCDFDCASDLILSFQSTHLWKVRPTANCNLVIIFEFQSTHLWKVRHGHLYQRVDTICISIHAPVKGATWHLGS